MYKKRRLLENELMAGDLPLEGPGRDVPVGKNAPGR